MLRFVILLLGIITCQSAGASEALLRGFLSDAKTLQAQFEQKVVDESGMTLDLAQGEVYLSRPGKFRWDYFAENDAASSNEQAEEVLVQQLVADGESIFVFDPDLEQVSQRSLEDAINQVPSLLLVEDGQALDTFFSVSDIGLTDGLSWVSLKPKSAEATFQQLLLAFSGEQLAVIQFVDGLGNETRLRLSSVQTNQALAADTFEFVVPAGADLRRD